MPHRAGTNHRRGLAHADRDHRARSAEPLPGQRWRAGPTWAILPDVWQPDLIAGAGFALASGASLRVTASGQSREHVGTQMNESPLFCERCGAELEPGKAEFYVVRIEAFAAAVQPSSLSGRSGSCSSRQALPVDAAPGKRPLPISVLVAPCASAASEADGPIDAKDVVRRVVSTDQGHLIHHER